MRIPIAKELTVPIALVLLIGLILLVWLPWLGFATLIIGILLAAFFRDPVRIPDYGPGDFISPADGKVVAINRAFEGQYLHEDAQKVSIFLSIFNVHMNYAPVTGRVSYLRYSPGRFIPANSYRASLENENNAIGITGPTGRVMVRQIAGIIARRIVCDCDVGSNLIAGQKIGMIKFGSRVDIYLPPQCRLFVNVGDHVKGGETLLGSITDEKDISRS